MCILVVVPAKVTISPVIFNNFKLKNHDGWGVLDLDTLISHKGIKNFEDALTFINNNRNHTRILHLRKATVGNISLENTHPFKCNDGFLFHNGTIPFLSKSKNDVNDTNQLVSMLNDIEDSIFHPTIRDLVGIVMGKSRLLYSNYKGRTIILSDIEWYKYSDLFVSNTYSWNLWKNLNNPTKRKPERVTLQEWKNLNIDFYLYKQLAKKNNNTTITYETATPKVKELPEFTLELDGFIYDCRKSSHNNLLVNFNNGHTFVLTQSQLLRYFSK